MSGRLPNPSGMKSQPEHTFTVLNIIVSTPENRQGAVRAGLQLGKHISNYADVDTVKMASQYDNQLASELGITDGFHQTPSRTALRDVVDLLGGTEGNYENTMIWTELSTPRPLSHYDIAHIHNPVPLWGFISASLRCRFAGLPYAVTTHGISKIPDMPREMEMGTTLTKVFEYSFVKPYRSVLTNADHLFALSNTDIERIEAIFPGKSHSLIRNGVELNQEDGSLVRDELSIDLSKPLLLFVGELLPSKGINVLLEAYRQLETDCSLVIVGSGKQERILEEIASFSDDDLIYLGYTKQELLDGLFSEADLFVLPTKSDVFPLVNLEAMAAGTPVISTNVGGIPEQITEDVGVLVPPDDPEAVVEAIEDLLHDDNRREAMGQAALRDVKQNYSWESIAKQTVSEYAKVIK